MALGLTKPKGTPPPPARPPAAGRPVGAGPQLSPRDGELSSTPGAGRVEREQPAAARRYRHAGPLRTGSGPRRVTAALSFTTARPVWRRGGGAAGHPGRSASSSRRVLPPS